MGSAELACKEILLLMRGYVAHKRNKRRDNIYAGFWYVSKVIRRQRCRVSVRVNVTFDIVCFGWQFTRNEYFIASLESTREKVRVKKLTTFEDV